MTEIKNALIKSTMLGREDHGALTFYLYLDYGSTSQGFGGYVLDDPVKDDEGKFIYRRGTAFGCEAIIKVMEIVGVDSWEKLPGKYCRVESAGSWDGAIIQIGNILKDRWLNLKELAAKFKEGKVNEPG